jgi:hypothetical protein
MAPIPEQVVERLIWNDLSSGGEVNVMGVSRPSASGQQPG